MYASLLIFGAWLMSQGSAGAVAAQTLPERSVPEHVLPVPSTVSPEMRELIANSPAYAVSRNSPTTNAGWLKVSNPHPDQLHASIVRLLDRLDLTLSERAIAGVHCYVVQPAPRNLKKNRLLVNVHGGGYVLGAGESGLTEAILVAGATGIRTIAVDYRMPPDHPFPIPVDDAVVVWKAVTAYAKAPVKVGIFGSSTGGAIALEVTQRAISEHFRVPDAVFAGTPWSDLSETGDSYFVHKYADPLVYDGGLSVMAQQYAHGASLKDPRLSPIYGSFVGFPSTLLISGTRDLLLSDTVRVDRKLRDAGAHSELIVYEGQGHGMYLAGLDYKETKTFMKDVAAFFRKALG